MSTGDQAVKDLMHSILNHLGPMINSKLGSVFEDKEGCVNIALPTDAQWVVILKNNEFDMTLSNPTKALWTGIAYPRCETYSGCSWSMVAWLQKLLFRGYK